MTTLRDVQPASRVLQYDPFLRFFFSIIRRESGVAASAGGFLDLAEESGMLIRCSFLRSAKHVYEIFYSGNFGNIIITLAACVNN